MNIVLFAWCPTSVLYLDALAAAGVVPCLVVTGTRTSARAPLALSCDRLGATLERRSDVDAPELRARVGAADLLLIAGCARILGPELCAAPRLGALNFHPSRLPDYRGKEPLFWALLRGEPLVGITVHRVTEDVDAGPILFQREVAVPPRATSASLAVLVDRAGAELVPDLIALAAADALPAGHRSPDPGTRFPPLRAEHGLLDFTRDAVDVDRLVRAAQGEIAAYTFFRGFRFVVLEGDADEAGSASSIDVLPGRVAEIDGDALVIAAARGVYRARRFLFLDRIHDGPALAAALGIVPGAALSANPAF